MRDRREEKRREEKICDSERGRERESESESESESEREKEREEGRGACHGADPETPHGVSRGDSGALAPPLFASDEDGKAGAIEPA
jgi:hypothetical protein